MAATPRLDLRLGLHAEAVAARLERWRRTDVGRRLVERDPTLWFDDAVPELEDRLGWLDLPYVDQQTLADWTTFADDERGTGISRVVVLGMGGSSLAPEVYQRTFGQADDFVAVLDSTHPEAIRQTERELDLARTLFVVSSKSGSTIETRSLFEHFWSRATAETDAPGRRFVAITDPGSSLEELAQQRGLHRVFQTPADVGGRYSALTAFGLVPGALAGLELPTFVARARGVADALSSDPEVAEEVLLLGAVLGELALNGRDKLTLWTSPALSAFPDWLEQLVAESTGKRGHGILPVVGEAAAADVDYADDRVFVALVLEDDGERQLLEPLGALADRGHPTVVIRLRDRFDLAAEIFRWEVAVGLSGSILGINPFSQPDVQLAKRLAQEVLAGSRSSRPIETLRWSPDVGDDLVAWLDGARQAPYLSVQAYMPSHSGSLSRLRRLQRAMRDRSGRAATIGIGPRFLHSTGQLHKGGVSNARFLQIVTPWDRDLPIPGETLSFGDLLRAQADGDGAALLERGQHVLRFELTEESDLEAITDSVREG